MLTPRILPACRLLLLPLRFKLPVLFTEDRFFKVPLREGAAPWFKVEALEADRSGKFMSPSSKTDEPRVRASKFSSNLPNRSL